MKQVKDKKITRQRRVYTATAEFYQDRSDLSRDDDAPVSSSFESLIEAQKFLADFPPDVWDGNEFINYKPLI
jgi:hypothetical protein